MINNRSRESGGKEEKKVGFHRSGEMTRFDALSTVKLVRVMYESLPSFLMRENHGNCEERVHGGSMLHKDNFICMFEIHPHGWERTNR